MGWKYEVEAWRSAATGNTATSREVGRLLPASGSLNLIKVKRQGYGCVTLRGASHLSRSPHASLHRRIRNLPRRRGRPRPRLPGPLGIGASGGGWASGDYRRDADPPPAPLRSYLCFFGGLRASFLRGVRPLRPSGSTYRPVIESRTLTPWRPGFFVPSSLLRDQSRREDTPDEQNINFFSTILADF